jgi:hypothetical protein
MRTLVSIDLENYKGDHTAHVLEQYKIFGEMLDRTLRRRESANKFFLTLSVTLLSLLSGLCGGILYFDFFDKLAKLSQDNAEIAIGTAIGEVSSGAMDLFLMIALGASLLCLAWKAAIGSLDSAANAKRQILEEMEAFLPLRGYRAEREVEEKALRTHKFSGLLRKLEPNLPLFFLAVYLSLPLIVGFRQTGWQKGTTVSPGGSLFWLPYSRFEIFFAHSFIAASIFTLILIATIFAARRWGRASNLTTASVCVLLFFTCVGWNIATLRFANLAEWKFFQGMMVYGSGVFPKVHDEQGKPFPLRATGLQKGASLREIGMSYIDAIAAAGDYIDVQDCLLKACRAHANPEESCDEAWEKLNEGRSTDWTK